LIKLIGPERELFLKGRRCENQGLGIGAFAYYRRVVENQKSRILGEIIKVSEKLNIPSEHTSILKAAQKETQFSRAMESVKDVVPQSLLINGYNPMLLLHKALSQGLHNQTDESCLENASSIRIVLAELADKLSQALRDEAELNNALTRLMAKKNSQDTLPHPVCVTQVDGAGSNAENDSVVKPEHRRWAWVDEHVGVVAASRVHGQVWPRYWPRRRPCRFAGHSEP
jgi:hypothetical protein